jgi:hypothetical protein
MWASAEEGRGERGQEGERRKNYDEVVVEGNMACVNDSD